MHATHREDLQDVEPRRGYHDTTVERRWNMAPGQVITVIAGVGFVILGLVAVARAGLETPWSVPVVTVLGFTHTTWLGIAEIAVGLLLVLAGMDTFSRGAIAFLGLLLVIAGVLVQAVPEDLPSQLALDEDMGMPLVLVGAVIALAAMLLPTWRGRSVDRVIDLQDAHQGPPLV